MKRRAILNSVKLVLIAVALLAPLHSDFALASDDSDCGNSNVELPRETNVAYDCTSTFNGLTLHLRFQAKIETVTHCSSSSFSNPGFPIYCQEEKQARGRAQRIDFNGSRTEFRFLGMNPNPNLKDDYLSYVFRERRHDGGPRSSLVVNIKLGAPEHSFYLLSNENGLAAGNRAEQRKINCEIAF